VASGSAGYLLSTVGAGTGSTPLLLLAALLLGAGGGLAFAAGLGLTARLAQPARRGALRSTRRAARAPARRGDPIRTDTLMRVHEMGTH
jgi:MFS family permease